MVDTNAMLRERGARYGDFASHAQLAMDIKYVLRCSPNYGRLRPYAQHALEVIADKIARVINGDQFYPDNWEDIIGYARLVLNLNAQSPPVQTKVTPADLAAWRGLQNALAQAEVSLPPSGPQ